MGERGRQLPRPLPQRSLWAQAGEAATATAAAGSAAAANPEAVATNPVAAFPDPEELITASRQQRQQLLGRGHLHRCGCDTACETEGASRLRPGWGGGTAMAAEPRSPQRPVAVTATSRGRCRFATAHGSGRRPAVIVTAAGHGCGRGRDLHWPTAPSAVAVTPTEMQSHTIIRGPSRGRHSTSATDQWAPLQLARSPQRPVAVAANPPRPWPLAPQDCPWQWSPPRWDRDHRRPRQSAWAWPSPPLAFSPVSCSRRPAAVAASPVGGACPGKGAARGH